MIIYNFVYTNIKTSVIITSVRGTSVFKERYNWSIWVLVQ